jgi:4-hydroxy-tetrahydrodipicolinate synthase
VIAGTGTNETQATHDLTLFAKEHGADAALLVTPYYNKPTQQGLYEHFRLIAENVDIPIILYNVPGRTAVNMLPETQLLLAENCKNIIATKEASGDIEQMMEIIKNAPNGFVLFSGDDSLAVPVIAVGGVGVISVLSNYATKEFAECVNLALKGKFKEAMKIHFKLMELMELNFIESNPIPVKSAMSLMNLAKEVYRLPLIPIKPVNKRKIKKALLDAGLI